MRLGCINTVDGFTRIYNLLGKNDTGVSVVLLCGLLKRTLYFLLLSLYAAYLPIKLITLFPYLVRPFLHLPKVESNVDN